MIEKIQSNNLYKILICAGISVLAAILIYLHYDLFLRTDDVGMRNILSGLYTGTPEAHVLFMKYPLSWVLAGLYSIFPGVYWYFVIFEIIDYACLALILYSLVRRINKYVIILTIIFTAVFLAFWISNLITLEWTSTAGLLSAAAIIWYFFIPNELGKTRLIFNYAVSVFLFALSYNLRSSVFEMAVPFMIMAILIKWFCKKDKDQKINKKNILRDLVYICVVIAVLAGSYAIDKVAYSGEEWQEARAYSSYRSTLYDRYKYPDYDEYADVYEANDITEEMYDVIKDDYNLMMASKGVLTSENLKEIAELSKENFYARHSFLGQIKSCIQERLQAMFDDDYKVFTIVFYAGIILAALCAIFRKGWGNLFLEIIFVIGFESLWIYLYYGNRLPLYVGQSLYLLGFVVIAALLYKEPLFQKIWKFRWAQLVVVLVAAFLFIREIDIIQTDNNYRANRALLIQEVKEYCENNSSNIYYREFNSFGQNDGRDQIKVRDELTAANFFPANGWTVSLPLENQFMPTDGSQELCSWISDQDNFYLLVSDERAEGVCERTENLFASRGIDCTLQLEDEIQISNGMLVYVYHFVCK